MVKNLLHIYSAGVKCQWCEDHCMSLNISGPISCPLFLSLWKREESSKRRANYTVQNEMSGQLLRDHTRSSLFWLSWTLVAQVDIQPLGLHELVKPSHHSYCGQFCECTCNIKHYGVAPVKPARLRKENTLTEKSECF